MLGVFQSRPPHHRMDFVSFLEEKLDEVRPVLTSGSGDQRLFHVLPLRSAIRDQLSATIAY